MAARRRESALGPGDAAPAATPAAEPSPSPQEAAEHVERLRRAEIDLQNAIAECTLALDQVRRELGWRDARSSNTIH